MSYEKQPQPDMVSGQGAVQWSVRPASRGTGIASAVVGVASIFVGWSVVVPLIGLVLGLLGLQQHPGGKDGHHRIDPQWPHARGLDVARADSCTALRVLGTATALNAVNA
jgi:hypothetical protein